MDRDETDPIYLQALEWFVRMKDENVGAQDRRAFADWIADDPTHRAAYERASSLWDRFDIVKPEYEKMRAAPGIGRRGLLVGGLATVALGALAYRLTQPRGLADHTTGIGERRAFTLADGSLAELGSYSALSVDFTGRERRVILHDGQAFFRVAADAARPFVVVAGRGSIRALGTQFDVKLAREAVTVSVAEHAVRVTPPASAPVTVGEGWQVAYQAGEVAAALQVDMERVTAWRDDRIVFEDAPLRLVLKELERYRHGPIVLAQDDVGEIPVTAVFDTREAASALATIARTLPIRVLDAAGYMAVVYRR